VLLKKLKLEWKYDVGRNLIKKLRSKLNDRELLLCLANDLVPEMFVQYNYSIGSSTQVKVLYQNIENYIEQYKYYNNVLRQQSYFKPIHLIEIKESMISLNNLFISKDGYYINPYQGISELRTQVITLCTLMASSDDIETGPSGHNNRILKKHFINLQDLFLVLIDLSLQKRI
jgi:hypothetical protein